MPLNLQKNTAPLLFLSSILIMLIGSCGRGPITGINNRIYCNALEAVRKSGATTIRTVAANSQQQHYDYGFELLQYYYLQQQYYQQQHFQPQQQHFQPQQQHFQPQQQHFQPQQQHFQLQQQHFQLQQQHFQPQQQHFQLQQQHFQLQQQHFQLQQQHFQPQQQHYQPQQWNHLQYLEIVKRRAEEARKEAYEELIRLEQTKIRLRVYAISMEKELYNREQNAKRKVETAIRSEKIAEKLQEQLK